MTKYRFIVKVIGIFFTKYGATDSREVGYYNRVPVRNYSQLPQCIAKKTRTSEPTPRTIGCDFRINIHEDY